MTKNSLTELNRRFSMGDRSVVYNERVQIKISVDLLHSMDVEEHVCVCVLRQATSAERRSLVASDGSLCLRIHWSIYFK